MAGRLFRRIDHWLFREYRLGDLRAYRIVVALYALMMYFPTATWAPSLPREFWLPPSGLARLLPPSEPFVLALNGVLLISLLWLLSGYLAPWASLASAASIVLINSLAYSFGKINHDILVPIAAACMAFSGWGGGKRRAWCPALLATSIGIGMFTAGWPKLTTGWLDHRNQVVQGIAEGYDAVWPTICGRLCLRSYPAWLWEAQDWLAVLLEIVFIVAVVRLSWFRGACAVACVFHLGILLTLDIPFSSNVMAYAAFFPVPAILARWRWWLPASLGVVAILCPWHGPREFVAQAVVAAGGVLAIGWLTFKLLGKVRDVRRRWLCASG